MGASAPNLPIVLVGGDRVGKVWDYLFPSYNERLMDPSLKLAADVEDGLLRRVPNPPNIQPTSSLTSPISVLSAVDAMRKRYVSRQTLMGIPAFRRAITVICGTAGSLPYHAINTRGEKVSHSLLQQPESTLGLTRSVTMTRTAEDLLLDGASLWIVLSRDSTGFATAVRRIPFHEWSQDPGTGEILYDGEKVPASDARLFTSPFEGLCNVAGPTVFIIERLRNLSAKYAKNPQAREYFQATGGQVLDEDTARDLLADLEQAREAGVSGFLPEDLSIHQVAQMTPEQMMLVSAQEFGVAEVSRLTGVDPTWLAVNVSTRTYSNKIDERRDFLDFVVMPSVILPIEERLSLGDTTPNGQVVKANLDAFLRMNTLERMQAYEVGSRVGAYDPQRIAELENLPRVIQPTKPTPTGDTE